MNKNISLTVIVPFYNEERYLTKSLENLLKIKIIDEIILVDNGSTDTSYKIANSFNKQYEHILLLSSDEEMGKGFAVQKGIAFATSSHMVVHDADLEYFPTDIIKLFDTALKYPNDIILGSRIKGSIKRKNLYVTTYVGNRILSFYFSILNGCKVSDISTCYQLYSLENIRKLQLSEKGFAMEVEVLSKLLKNKVKIHEVPIRYEGRSYADGKKIRIKDAINIAIKILKFSRFNLFS
jgi:dolichol-phosphate mannosyltransferase